MRTSRRPATAAGLALGLAALALVTSGCTVASPKTVLTPYAASDGVNGELGAVKLRNLLVVTEAAGKPGVVIGSLAADGTEPVQVQLAAVGADGSTSLGRATVTIQPGQLATLGTGDGATSLQLSEVPVAPGATLTLHVTTQSGGTDLRLPVLSPTNEYATITPTQAPTTSATPTATATPSATS